MGLGVQEWLCPGGHRGQEISWKQKAGAAALLRPGLPSSATRWRTSLSFPQGSGEAMEEAVHTLLNFDTILRNSNSNVRKHSVNFLKAQILCFFSLF